MNYIKPTAVKALVNSLGKRTGRDYLHWLDAKVEEIVRRDALGLRGMKTLNRLDADAGDALQKLRRS